MGPDRERLIHDKQILLFRRLCEDAGVDDPGLSDLLINGVKLTGQAEETGQFETLIVEPTMSDVQLMKSSKWTRRKIMSGRNDGSPQDVRSHIWQEALKETEKGWLSGPFSEGSLAIDALSESFANAAYGSSYKLDLPGIGVSTMARTWLESTGDQCNACFHLSEGMVLRGKLREIAARRKSLLHQRSHSGLGFGLQTNPDFKGVIESSAGVKKLFVSNVRPFGASASVYAFNRLARCLHTIGERIFGLVWSNYYDDDYPQLDIEASDGDAQMCAERLFHLLGWRASFKETKRKPAGTEFDVLGVTFDFHQSLKGNILVRNKASRIRQLVSEANGYLHRGQISASEATSLRGKLQFADTRTFGRLLATYLRAISAGFRV